MPAARLPVSLKIPLFPQSLAACHPSRHPASEHPVAAPSADESHPQHPHIPFCRLPAAKAPVAALPICGQSPQSAPRFHSQHLSDILF